MNARRAPHLLVAVLLLTSTLPAQVHKDTRRGLQFTPPKNLATLALQPNSFNPIARFQSEKEEVAGNNSMFTTFELNFYPKSTLQTDKTPEERMEQLWEDLESSFGFSEVLRSKTFKLAGAEATEKHIAPESEPLRLYAVVLPQDDGIYVFEGVSLTDRFDKNSSDFSKAVRSFKRIKADDPEAREAERSQMSKQDRFLQDQIDRLPAGWSSLRTRRYLFLSNADKDFVKDLSQQIEVIRDTYEKLYPPDKPIEAVSIVRVCDSFDTYRGYGGPDGTGGYWSYATQELVIFDNPPRSVTHAVLNHEAFHQYIYYYYGQLSPHSWYNEGHGDYFAGAKMSKTWKVGEFGDAPGGIARQETVKQAVRESLQGRKGATPLKDLMHFSQAEYYEDAGVHYAQGWALVHMLRESKSLKPAWARILPDYLDNLLAARLEVATEVMQRAHERADKKEAGSSAKLPQTAEEYFDEASLQHEDEIQDRAYAKTFASWSDDDWDEFNRAYLAYVEAL